MRRFFLLGLLVAAALLIGCPVDQNLEDIGNTNITIDDVKGEWDFENVEIGTTTYEHVHLSILPPTTEWPNVAVDLHLGHDDAYDGPFYMGYGTMEGNKFTGKYIQQISDDNTDNTEYAFIVSFSLLDEKLRAEFDAEGPLKGLVLKYGIKSED